MNDYHNSIRRNNEGVYLMEQGMMMKASMLFRKSLQLTRGDILSLDAKKKNTTTKNKKLQKGRKARCCNNNNMPSLRLLWGNDLRALSKSSGGGDNDGDADLLNEEQLFIYQRPLYIIESEEEKENHYSAASTTKKRMLNNNNKMFATASAELTSIFAFNLALSLQIQTTTLHQKTGSSIAAILESACKGYEIAFQARRLVDRRTTSTRQTTRTTTTTTTMSTSRKQQQQHHVVVLLDMAILNNCGQARIQLSNYSAAERCMRNLTRCLQQRVHNDDLLLNNDELHYYEDAVVKGFVNSALWKIPHYAAAA